MTARVRNVPLAAGCLALLGADIWLLTHTPSWIPVPGWLGLMGAAWILFAAGIWLTLGLPRRAAAMLILLGGIGLPLAAGFAPPRSSDDMYRYVWDGRVQAAGIDPYRYAPAAPELVPLRDEFLWPPKSAWCLQPGAVDAEQGRPLTEGCSLINRPHVHTIYPPVAQAYFTAMHVLSPAGAREWPMQLGAVAFAVAATVLLLVALPRFGIDQRFAVGWAWCPLVALEAGNNAHVDVVAAFLAAAALVVLARKRAIAGGVLWGLAIAVKVTPALIGPALLRRRPIAVVCAAVGTVVLVYLPHMAAVGAGVLGYMPGYLSEEGYTSGTRFALFTLILPEGAAIVVAALTLAALAAVVVWRSDPDRPWDAALLMVGGALLVTTPVHSWYALLLVVLVGFTGRWEWLAIAAAGYVAQYGSELRLGYTAAERLGYGLALAVIIAVAVVRRRRTPRPAGPSAGRRAIARLHRARIGASHPPA